MTLRARQGGGLAVLALVAMLGTGSCGNDGPFLGNHEVFFAGYVYNGATGARLAKADLEIVSIKFRANVIKVDIEDDGRFVSKDPLPTWQDYVVSIKATGFREFVSFNVGFDVPASLAMTDGISRAATTQTFDIDAYLFPTAIKAPKVSLTITVPDDVTGAPVSAKVNGTIRLRPQSQSAIQIGVGGVVAGPSRRVWANDQDLLTKTVLKTITDGRVEFAEAISSTGSCTRSPSTMSLGTSRCCRQGGRGWWRAR